MGSSAQRHLTLIVSILVSILLTHQIIHSLAVLDTTVMPEVYLRRSLLALAAFFLPVIGGWYSLGRAGGIVFSLMASVMVFFVGLVAGTAVAYWCLLEYLLLLLILARMDQYFETLLANLTVSREKYQNEKNDLEISYRSKGEGISIFFEKYSTYYNLRKLAEELAKILSVSELSKTVVKRTSDFIPRGDIVVIALSDPEGGKLSVVASRKIHPRASLRQKEGDLFDWWAVRNRKRLIVNDAHQDFRFDISKTAKNERLRSLLVAPLFHEGRVMGTLRINSADPSVFANDDLRLLDAIGTLASSALSNALLYEKTVELAIRDSLTGLYVRRYFYDRLKREHRRALMTKRPLSLLMCDLDHFKECNDRFGHGAGDLMLLQVAKILNAQFDDALVARYGGEEFAVIMPETSKDEAVGKAEEVRLAVSQAHFDIRREKIKMTLSIGVASLPADTLDIETLVRCSDEALYEAKRTGRNRVCSSKG